MSYDYNAMPTSPDALMQQLKAMKIAYDLHHHEAVYTVAESEKISRTIQACHTRNMFLRTKKKKNYLVTLPDETPIDLKKLGDVLGAGRFSFGSPERLFETLGVYPGSVTPLSVVNAAPQSIEIILEKEMMESDVVAYHPLQNTMTLTMAPHDLVKFMQSYGHEPRIVDLSLAAPE